MRDKLMDSLKIAMKAGDKPRVSAVRMIQAELKDKDIEARGLGGGGSGVLKSSKAVKASWVIRQRGFFAPNFLPTLTARSSPERIQAKTV